VLENSKIMLRFWPSFYWGKKWDILKMLDTASCATRLSWFWLG